jgi:benzoate/toluate 1,2-dioxygenase reductase subunit
MHAALLRFADGGALTLTVAPEQTVLDAAMAADAPLRYDCAAGACGSCVVHLRQGRTECDAAAPSPLSPAEAADGLRATCMTRLLSDAVFDLPYPLTPTPSPAARLSARVESVGRAAATVHQLVLQLDDPEAFRFQAGQYMRLRPPGARVARAYSMASAPDSSGRLEFLIRHVPGGVMSDWLAERAQVGERLTLHGPLGGFAFDARAARHVFLAGGTGLAPALSILREASVRDGGAGLGSALLCFGCTTAEDLFYEAEIHALAAATPGLEARVAVLQGGSERGVRAGTALSLLSPADLAPGAAYYLCGPPPMIDASRAWLTAHGVAPGAIRSERYIPA